MRVVGFAQRDPVEQLVVLDVAPEISRELEEAGAGQRIVLVHYNAGQEHAALVVCPTGDLPEKLRKRRSHSGRMWFATLKPAL